MIILDSRGPLLFRCKTRQMSPLFTYSLCLFQKHLVNSICVFHYFLEMHVLQPHRRRKSTMVSSSSRRLPRSNEKIMKTPFHFRKNLSFRIWALLICSISYVFWTRFLVDVGNRRNSELEKSVETKLLKGSTRFIDDLKGVIDTKDKAMVTDDTIWFWVGIVRDAKEVQESTWDALAHAACSSSIHIHITVSRNADYAEDQLVRQRIGVIQMKSAQSYANIYIEGEKDLGITSLPSNRIERIAVVRDAQRQRVRQLWEENRPANASFQKDVVIVADLDLFRLPVTTGVLTQAKYIAEHDDLDVVCAAGVTMASRHELWYYDTFATVLLPDTYVHPLKRRLVKNYYAGEDPNLVRSDNQNGSFTQGDIMRYFQQQSAATGTARVRSCFGGLAIYRATTWFEESCSYTLNNTKSLERYASAADGRPCEHIAFHTCLQDTESISKAKIAVNPGLLTLWRKN